MPIVKTDVLPASKEAWIGVALLHVVSAKDLHSCCNLKFDPRPLDDNDLDN